MDSGFDLSRLDFEWDVEVCLSPRHAPQPVFEIGCEIARAEAPGSVLSVLQAMRALVREQRQSFDGIDAIGAGYEIDIVAVGITLRFAPDIPRDMLVDADAVQIESGEKRPEELFRFDRQLNRFILHLRRLNSSPSPAS